MARSRFKLPPEAAVGFRLTIVALTRGTFTMCAWGGAGKWGWFDATFQSCSRARPGWRIKRQRLRKGEWRTLLNHAQQCRLWELPEVLEPPDPLMKDGLFLGLTIQDARRHHGVSRDNDILEPGLARTVNYLLRAAAAFAGPLAPILERFVRPVHPILPPEPAAEPAPSAGPDSDGGSGEAL